MIWVTGRKEALAVAIAERTAELSTPNEDLRRGKAQLDELFELSPDAVILTGLSLSYSTTQRRR
jgi:hypothetical protein